MFVLSYCFSEMSPVCAVVGGVLGQEVVKVGMLTGDEPQRLNVINAVLQDSLHHSAGQSADRWPLSWSALEKKDRLCDHGQTPWGAPGGELISKVLEPNNTNYSLIFYKDIGQCLFSNKWVCTKLWKFGKNCSRLWICMNWNILNLGV